MVLRKSFYIHWSAGWSPRVHEVNPGRDPSRKLSLLGFVHTVEGSPFQVQGAIGKAATIRGRFRRKPGCGFGSYYV